MQDLLRKARQMEKAECLKPKFPFGPSGGKEYIPIGLQRSPSLSVFLSGGSHQSFPSPEDPAPPHRQAASFGTSSSQGGPLHRFLRCHPKRPWRGDVIFSV